jgi:hypothetical protein
MLLIARATFVTSMGENAAELIMMGVGKQKCNGVWKVGLLDIHAHLAANMR